MLECKICQKVLPPSHFYADARLKRGYDNRCKKCRIEYNLQYYRKKKGTWSWEQYIAKIKEAGCAACGIKKEKCLDFHHVSGKDFTICEYRKLTQKLIDEIGKCIILCANCHRLHHAGEFAVDHIPLIKTIPLKEFLNQ